MLSVVVSLLLCPSCGGGLPTRRGFRRHLESHGWEPERAFTLASETTRSEAPSAWKCLVCRRRFPTVRGLIRHVRARGHLAGEKPSLIPGPPIPQRPDNGGLTSESD